MTAAEPTQPDPKEQMREALERKNAVIAQHATPPGGDSQGGFGAPQGKAGGKRVFRRKSGG